MNLLLFFCVLLQLSWPVLSSGASVEASSIVFATYGRSDYAFDVFTVPARGPPPSASEEIQVTDGESVNFNGHFPPPSSTSTLLSLFTNQSRASIEQPNLQLVYVSERSGISNIYYVAVSYGTNPRAAGRRSDLEIPSRIQVPLLDIGSGENRISMKDRPTVTGDYLVYVSTHEDTGVPRTSWAAVYSTHLKSGVTRRLTPYGIADFSPAVSPSGLWTAVASYGEKGWNGAVEELRTDIYVFLTRDGTQRVKVVDHGGWPCWVDDSTLYFHRRGADGWWSIYRAILRSRGAISTQTMLIERVTPPGLHAFTPATSPGNKNFIAVATRRLGSDFRHIELVDPETGEFKELTRLVSPQTHHFNPFISSDSSRIGYHKCRGEVNGGKATSLLLENIRSPIPDISLFRIDGSFPSFSSKGDRIAYVKFPGVYVMNRDGSNRRQVYSQTAFATAWDPVRRGTVYTSTGPTFASESTDVDVIAIEVDNLTVRKLTTNGKNNAFPSPSPDGKWIVFRSGLTGNKNLYIMDAIKGESGGLRRLTEGSWTDTMCSWSPDGEWIVFASDREDPGSGSFELYLIHPNGTGLRKLIQSGSAGRTNHPWFSPDGKSLVFTSDYAGVSAEPISNPHHYQPYGEIFTIKLDGSGLTRMTHSSYEDGTPTWGPRHIDPIDVVGPATGPHCQIEDCHWLNGIPKGASTMAQCGL